MYRHIIIIIINYYYYYVYHIAISNFKKCFNVGCIHLYKL